MKTTFDKPKFEVMGELSKKYPKLYNLHDTLWQIFINRSVGLKRATFTPVMGDVSPLAVGLACENEPGYIRTTILVEEDVNHDDLSVWIDDINKTIFEQTEEESINIVASSMRTQNKRKGR